MMTDDTMTTPADLCDSRGESPENIVKSIHYNQSHLMMGEEESLPLLATTATNNKDNDNAVKTDNEGQWTVMGGRANVGSR
jgi:hypothetical protein